MAAPFILPYSPLFLSMFRHFLHRALVLAISTGFLRAEPKATMSATVGNGKITRALSWEQGALHTVSLKNELIGREFIPTSAAEFAITFRAEGSKEDTRVTAVDFQVIGSERFPDALLIRLTGRTAPMDVTVRYEAKTGEAWLRKELTITAKQSLTLDKVEVENLDTTDAYEPYRGNQMLAKGAAKWRPPLGQPVYARASGTWWGMEFPAARNQVVNGKLICGYLTEAALKAGETWKSHSAAVGVADDPGFEKDAFFAYIDATRARPLRLQVQYNCWFDYGKGVATESFTASVRKIHEELVQARGVAPLNSYVIDDGWQDTGADWSQTGVWPVNSKFPDDFKGARAAVTEAKAKLGLWLSPGCLFGATSAIPKMKAAGWRALNPWMSMTGDAYMTALETRMVELAKSGVSFFKLDGVFGHLNTRNFDIEGFKGGEPALDSADHDEAKERYLALGSERLIRIFDHVGRVNPDVFLVISNGAFLSPWWLQHVDAVWMINAGDAANGADRTGELVYRDKVYYGLASDKEDNTQFPLNSIFNHEPKKTSTGESAETFRRYLFMSLARGTALEELYLKTFLLTASDWDVIAEGLKWSVKAFPAFKRARMIGGSPAMNEAYGYAGWADRYGYVSLHNPAATETTFRFVLNRSLGMTRAEAERGLTYTVASPLAGDTDGLAKSFKSGTEVAVTLPPGAVRLLEFSASGK